MANKRKFSSEGPKKHRHTHVTKGRARSRSSSKRGSSANGDESTFPLTPNHAESQANRFRSSIATADFHDDHDGFVAEEEEDEII
jgi:hypothetical protein